jgi:hypothetical protein
LRCRWWCCRSREADDAKKTDKSATSLKLKLSKGVERALSESVGSRERERVVERDSKVSVCVFLWRVLDLRENGDGREAARSGAEQLQHDEYGAVFVRVQARAADRQYLLARQRHMDCGAACGLRHSCGACQCFQTSPRDSSPARHYGVAPHWSSIRWCQGLPHERQMERKF